MKKAINIALLFTYLLLPLLAGAVESSYPKLSGDNVLLIYKKNDTLSKKIADYYADKRHVPDSQVVGITLLGNPDTISRDKFALIQEQLAPYLRKNIKVLLMAWHAPYKVECMSITSAFTLGFDEKFCSHTATLNKGCHRTATSPFFNATDDMLWQQDGLRLSMMLSGQTFEEAKRLIDRGIAADNSHPVGQAYLVRTKDSARSLRWPTFESLVDIWPEKNGIKLHYIDDRYTPNKTSIRNKQNIMFYLTGHAVVPEIDSNTYLPGAIADHLTSYGGAGIAKNGQMKIYRWLEAGVTGSYGAVIEPCNYIEKFPNAQILIPSYLGGDSLIEAYWKSVQQPGEGVFVGEPLASPWRDN